jgi:hypothetical protein
MRAQVRLTTSLAGGAATDKGVGVTLGLGNFTHLDRVGDDFEKGDTQYYDLSLAGVSDMSDIDCLKIFSGAKDDWCLADMALLINGEIVFDQYFGHQNCRWFGSHDRGLSLLVARDTLRAHSRWRASPLLDIEDIQLGYPGRTEEAVAVLSLPHDELMGRLEGAVGDWASLCPVVAGAALTDDFVGCLKRWIEEPVEDGIRDAANLLSLSAEFDGGFICCSDAFAVATPEGGIDFVFELGAEPTSTPPSGGTGTTAGPAPTTGTVHEPAGSDPMPGHGSTTPAPTGTVHEPRTGTPGFDPAQVGEDVIADAPLEDDPMAGPTRSDEDPLDDDPPAEDPAATSDSSLARSMSRTPRPADMVRR